MAGDGLRHGYNFLCGPGGHHFAAVDTGLGSDVDDIVGGPHRILIVLHDDQGVAQVPQVLEGIQQHIIVPLVQADGRLVQDIQHAHEGGADLSCQPDALALAAGEGARLTAQGQVGKAHALQEGQAGANFFQNLLGDLGLRLGQRQIIDKGDSIRHGLVAELVDIQPAHGDGQGLLFQPPAPAGGAGALAHAVLQLFPGGFGLGLLEPPLHVVEDTLEGLGKGSPAIGPLVGQLELFALGAV